MVNRDLQTSFYIDEPLFEEGYVEPQEKPSGPFYKSKKFIFIAITIFLLLIALLIIFAPDSQQKRVIEEDQVQEQVPVNKDALTLKLEEIEVLLEQADPSTSELFFPAISTQIWLDEPE